jgi:hypothetical protein
MVTNRLIPYAHNAGRTLRLKVIVVQSGGEYSLSQ